MGKFQEKMSSIYTTTMSGTYTTTMSDIYTGTLGGTYTITNIKVEGRKYIRA